MDDALWRARRAHGACHAVGYRGVKRGRRSDVAELPYALRGEHDDRSSDAFIGNGASTALLEENAVRRYERQTAVSLKLTARGTGPAQRLLRCSIQYLAVVARFRRGLAGFLSLNACLISSAHFICLGEPESPGRFLAAAATWRL